MKIPPLFFRRTALLGLAAISLSGQATVAQVRVTQGTNLAIDVSPTDQRIVMDLLGTIWVLPRNGGEARKIGNGTQAVSRPRWSPDGERLVYQTVSGIGSSMWLLDLATSTPNILSDGVDFDQHPAWHPSGERIVFSSARSDSGFDLWEMHLETGLSWRLTHSPGDETEPAWSADGRDLAYIRRSDNQWRLVLRRHGQRDQDVVVSDTPLAAPSWRPDDSLLTYLRHGEKGYSLEMVILSDPPLVRQLAAGEDFFLSPAVWVDRLHFLYTADGIIKSRGINEWKAKKVSFAAEVRHSTSPSAAATEVAPLPVVTPSDQRFVVRADRLFDGVTHGYRRNVDVLVEDGLITSVEARRAWENATVLDLGDATIMPGLIDSYASLPAEDARELGLRLLSWGVTAIVADNADEFDAAAWESEATPGPRLLHAAALAGQPAETAPSTDGETAPVAMFTVPAAGIASGASSARESGVPLLAESWRTGIAAGADLLLGADTMPASPLGRRYRDIAAMAGSTTFGLVSGLADAATPGIEELLRGRQAQAFGGDPGNQPVATRRSAELPQLAGASSVVAGSKPNRLPPGLGLHAELLALRAAGLTGDEVLKSAGANAGAALRRPAQLGRVVPGALADLVLVAGDPLQNTLDTSRVVAVVRNGRFYSLVRLLEEAAAFAGVE